MVASSERGPGWTAAKRLEGRVAVVIGAGPPLQQRDIKKLMYQSLHTDLRTSLDSVSAHMAVIQSTADYREAVDAYKEKRKPKFRGR